MSVPDATLNQRNRWLRWTCLLILGVTLARAVYILFLCPYVLAEDEAHYWEWAARLDWSYYSKGPGVAWSIWLATTLFASDSEGVVRLPAVVSGAFLAGAVALTARRVYRGSPASGRITFLAAALALLTPAYQLPALVMTIEGPYLACWALAALALLVAFDPSAEPKRRVWPWIAFAAALGVGFLYKYTILLMLPGLVGFALTQRRHIARPPVAAWIGAIVVAALALSPVIIWNAANDWVTVRHLAGHLGLSWGDQPTGPGGGGWSYNPLWTLELIGTQLGIAGVTVALGVVGALRSRSTTEPSTRTAEALMLWLAIPIVVFYLLVTLKTDAEANWPIAGYLTLLPLAARAIADPMVRPKLTRGLWRAAIGLGLFSGIVMLRLDLLAAGIRALGPEISAGRLLSGEPLARDIHALRLELSEETGLDAMIIGRHYGRCSQLAYYLPDRQTREPRTVYCAASYTGGRKSQADFWDDTDLANLTIMAGRPAVLLSGTAEHWQPAFDRVVEIPNVPSDHKGDERTLFLGYGYRGFGATESTPPASGHAQEPRG